MSEPTPLSAEAQYPIEIIQGVEGFCIGLNNYRIAGPKPWGGGTVVKRWHIGVADLRKAIPELLATIDAQATEIEGYRQALAASKAEAVAWEEALEEWKVGSIRTQAELRSALRETRDQLERDFAIRCRCDFVTKLPAGIERCVGCRARDRIDDIERVLAGKEAQGD